MSATHAVRTPLTIHPKQIDRHQEASIVLAGYVNAGDEATSNIAALRTAAVATMGKNSTPVPDQPSTNDDVEGWLAGARAGAIQVNSDADGSKPEGPQGQEIYGTIDATGVITWVHSDGAGATTPVNLPAGTWSFIVGYNFWWYKLPVNAMRTLSRFPSSQDVGSASGTPTLEKLTIPAEISTAATALPAVSADPRVTVPVIAYINGMANVVLPAAAAAPGFTMAGRVVTYDPTTGRYPLETTDDVVIGYNK